MRSDRFHGISLTLAGVVIAWMGFIDPIRQAYFDFDGGWLGIAGITISLSASALGVAGAVYAACRL
jgi:hypothetical protein